MNDSFDRNKVDEIIMLLSNLSENLQNLQRLSDRLEERLSRLENRIIRTGEGNDRMEETMRQKFDALEFRLHKVEQRIADLRSQ
ncbi:MAG: hypothetical protein F4X69_13850 [Gemmatimonadetes bacterium]|nr:hypothetical protein [Gemmatimonadota bacterium]